MARNTQTDKLEFPLQPIAPNAGGGHWLPAAIPLTCSSSCGGKEFYVPVPRLENESTWTIYGDEAGRDINKPLEQYASAPLRFFCLTLVGLHHRRHDRVRRQIAKLKKIVVPNRDPDEWQHHFMDVWDSDARTGEFLLANKEAKIAYAKAFAKIIREARPELVTFNISSCIVLPTDRKERAKRIKAQNQEMFCLSLLTSLQHLRHRKKGVRWVFDNIKDSSGGARTEGWAKEAFLGLEYTRLFTWLSAGAPVLEPAFVKPGSNLLLEIADFASYCVARDFDKGIQGHKSEFPSSLLGEGFFQAVLRDGSIAFQGSRGLPVRRFFGIVAE